MRRGAEFVKIAFFIEANAFVEGETAAGGGFL
jgi:hypothetical protein